MKQEHPTRILKQNTEANILPKKMWVFLIQISEVNRAIWTEIQWNEPLDAPNESCCDSFQLFDNYETAEKGAELAYKELKKFLVKVRNDAHFILCLLHVCLYLI